MFRRSRRCLFAARFTAARLPWPQQCTLPPSEPLSVTHVSLFIRASGTEISLINILIPPHIHISSILSFSLSSLYSMLSRLAQCAVAAACLAPASSFSMYSLQDLGSEGSNVTLVDSSGHALAGGFALPALSLGSSVSPSLTADLTNGRFTGTAVALLSLFPPHRLCLSLVRLFCFVVRTSQDIKISQSTLSSGIFFITNGTSIVRFDQKAGTAASVPVVGGTLRHIAYDYKGPAANAPGHQLYGYLESPQMVLSFFETFSSNTPTPICPIYPICSELQEVSLVHIDASTLQLSTITVLNTTGRVRLAYLGLPKVYAHRGCLRWLLAHCFFFSFASCPRPSLGSPKTSIMPWSYRPPAANPRAATRSSSWTFAGPTTTGATCRRGSI